MEIEWLRDPNSITAHYITKLSPNFLRLMDSLFGTVFIFCYGLDLLVVVSLFLSEFSPFLFILCCVYLFASLLPSLFVKQILLFLFFFGYVRAFFSSFLFRSFHCLALATFVCQKIIPFGGLSTTVRSFCILQFLFFYPLHLPPFEKPSKLVDNSSPGYRTLISRKYP